MTIDEALEAICGLDTRDLVRIRETITALVAAAEERGAREERERVQQVKRVRCRYAHEGHTHAKVVLYVERSGRVESIHLAPTEFYVDDRDRLAAAEERGRAEGVAACLERLETHRAPQCPVCAEDGDAVSMEAHPRSGYGWCCKECHYVADGHEARLLELQAAVEDIKSGNTGSDGAAECLANARAQAFSAGFDGGFDAGRLQARAEAAERERDEARERAAAAERRVAELDAALQRRVDMDDTLADKTMELLAERDTLTALVAAAEERGRAEGVAACVESARASMETLTRLLGRHNDAVFVLQACIDTWSDGMGLTDEAGALHRLLAAHGREAAAEALEEAADEVEHDCPAWSDSHGLIKTWLHQRAAALREASTTEGKADDE